MCAITALAVSLTGPSFGSRCQPGAQLGGQPCVAALSLEDLVIQVDDRELIPISPRVVASILHKKAVAWTEVDAEEVQYECRH